MLGLTEAVKWIGATAVTCAAADLLLRLPFVEQRLPLGRTGRWYLIHAVTNTVVVAGVLPDCVRFLRDPIGTGMSGPYTDIPLAITVGLHAYHCAAEHKTLTVTDWAHHLVSNMLVSALAFPFRVGTLVPWTCLYVCGLPGGIDYYLLTAVKLNWMDKLTEKRWNRRINMYCRLPGILVYAPAAYCCYLYGPRTEYPVALIVLQGLLNSFNAIFFADRVVANHAVTAFKEEQEAAATKAT